MSIDELVEEGRRLARPCIYLKDTGPGPVVGLWYDQERAATQEECERTGELLWLTVDSTQVPDFPALPESRRYLAIYSNEQDGETGRVEERPALEDPTCQRKAIPLYAHAAQPLPPLDAVFARGSDPVGEWLAANGVQREWGYGSFRDAASRVVANGYLRLWEKEAPSWVEPQVYAVLGGWHNTGPAGDWFSLIDQRLVLWTHRQIEPSVEVWRSAEGDYTVYQRIS